MTTLSDSLAAYRICAKAEGKSPKTVKFVVQGVSSKTVLDAYQKKVEKYRKTVQYSYARG